MVAFRKMDPRGVEWREVAGFDGEETRDLLPGQYPTRNLKTAGAGF